MPDQKRAVTIVGNWKMHKTSEESKSFIKELLPLIKDTPFKVYLAVPYTLIKPVAESLEESHVVVGAQNMNDADEGAFTGEIAGKMLADAGARFVILGHSERRKIFDESNDFINKKIKKALACHLQPILCIGETFDERESEKTDVVLKEQLTGCLKDLSEEEVEKIIIAYEPIWAIGAGFPATSDVAEATIYSCRKLIEQIFGKETAAKVSIIYGGSVKPENTKQFLDRPNIDGLLVGGASLSAETFSKIINYQEELVP